MFKTCFKCGISKSLDSDNFTKAKQNKNGFRGTCKDCDKEYHKEYQIINKQYLDLQKKEYRDNHKVEKYLCDKIYREKNKDDLSLKAKQRYEQNKDHILNRVLNYRKNNLDKIKTYKQANKDKINAIRRTWSELNKDRIAEVCRIYKTINKDKLRASRNERYYANQEKMIRRCKEYRNKNPDKIKASLKRYAELNPDKIHAKGALRRARLKEAYVEYVSRMKVYERDNGICGICRQWIDISYKSPHQKSLTLDHIVPITKGGKHSYDNVQVAHYSCNSSKGNRIKTSQS